MLTITKDIYSYLSTQHIAQADVRFIINNSHILTPKALVAKPHFLTSLKAVILFLPSESLPSSEILDRLCISFLFPYIYTLVWNCVQSKVHSLHDENSVLHDCCSLLKSIQLVVVLNRSSEFSIDSPCIHLFKNPLLHNHQLQSLVETFRKTKMYHNYFVDPFAKESLSQMISMMFNAKVELEVDDNLQPFIESVETLNIGFNELIHSKKHSASKSLSLHPLSWDSLVVIENLSSSDFIKASTNHYLLHPPQETFLQMSTTDTQPPPAAYRLPQPMLSRYDVISDSILSKLGNKYQMYAEECKQIQEYYRLLNALDCLIDAEEEEH